MLESPADEEDIIEAVGVSRFVELMELEASVLETPADEEETMGVLGVFKFVELIGLGEIELEAEIETPVKVVVEGTDVLTTVLETPTLEVPMLKVLVLGTLTVEKTELMVVEDMVEDILGGWLELSGVVEGELVVVGAEVVEETRPGDWVEE